MPSKCETDNSYLLSHGLDESAEKLGALVKQTLQHVWPLEQRRQLLLARHSRGINCTCNIYSQYLELFKLGVVSSPLIIMYITPTLKPAM